MKELSLLMLVVAIIILLTIFLKNIFYKDSHRNFFFIPNTSNLNIIWGMIFYLGYGFLTTHNDNLKIIFAVLIIFSFFYAVYLHQLRRFFNDKSSIAPLALINKKIMQQQSFDKNNPIYSPSQALKILGLHTSCIKNSQIILPRFDSLNQTYQNQKNLNSYFLEMIIKAKKTLIGE